MFLYLNSRIGYTTPIRTKFFSQLFVLFSKVYLSLCETVASTVEENVLNCINPAAFQKDLTNLFLDSTNI